MADIFTLELDGLPPDAKVVALHGAEAISQPYRFDVSVILPVDDGDFDLDAALEKLATLRVVDGHGATRARFVGEVHGAEFVHATARHLLFRVEIRPRLWRLANAFHSRVWVDKTFPEIVQIVLRESGVTDVQLNLTKRYAALPHVCQYQESDLAFVSRWMEREGVYFYFEHAEGGEVLHLTDDHASLTNAVDAPLRFFAADGDGDTSATESVRDFRRLHGMQSLAAKLFDYDYLKPSLDLSGESQVAGGTAGRVVAFGDNLRTPADARRLAQVRAEERGAHAARPVPAQRRHRQRRRQRGAVAGAGRRADPPAAHRPLRNAPARRAPGGAAGAGAGAARQRPLAPVRRQRGAGTPRPGRGGRRREPGDGRGAGVLCQADAAAARGAGRGPDAAFGDAAAAVRPAQGRGHGAERRGCDAAALGARAGVQLCPALQRARSLPGRGAGRGQGRADGARQLPLVLRAGAAGSGRRRGGGRAAVARRPGRRAAGTGAAQPRPPARQPAAAATR
jgi:uncharacterized protein involved in type VI secretion and phage assembly